MHIRERSPYIIEATGLAKRYNDGTLALRDITLNLQKKISIILGQNGAGKTTFLRILSTLLLPTSGSAKIFGYDVVRSPLSVRRMIVSIPQEAEPISILTPYEHLELFLTANEIPKERIDSIIISTFKKLDLYDARDKTADRLSGGMKRKIFVSMALASNAKLIFLDEPTLGLDPISRLEVWSAIKKLDCSVILTTHYMEEAKVLGNEIVLIDSGKVSMQGSVKELLKPLAGIMRVDGIGYGKMQFKIGDMKVSYIKSHEALRYADKGFEIKQPDLEDLFILKGFE